MKLKHNWNIPQRRSLPWWCIQLRAERDAHCPALADYLTQNDGHRNRKWKKLLNEIIWGRNSTDYFNIVNHAWHVYNTPDIAQRWLITGIQDGCHWTGSGNYSWKAGGATRFQMLPPRLRPCQTWIRLRRRCPTSADYRKIKMAAMESESDGAILSSGN